ncbi:MAG: hypothetical protein ACKOW9_01890 [Candidatus Paceibacterota bacterium]
MTKNFLIFVCLSISFVAFSCQKEPKTQGGPDCYQIPLENSVSIKEKKDLLGKKVYVEWSTTDGQSSSFTSTVEQVDTLLDSGVPILVINGMSSGQYHQYVSFTDPTQPLVTIILNKTDNGGLKVFKISPAIKGEGQVWNGGKSPIGVEETLTEIIIYTNNIPSPDGEKFMCMKVVIEK